MLRKPDEATGIVPVRCADGFRDTDGDAVAALAANRLTGPTPKAKLHWSPKGKEGVSMNTIVTSVLRRGPAAF